LQEVEHLHRALGPVSGADHRQLRGRQFVLVLRLEVLREPVEAIVLAADAQAAGLLPAALRAIVAVAFLQLVERVLVGLQERGQNHEHQKHAQKAHHDHRGEIAEAAGQPLVAHVEICADRFHRFGTSLRP
jgi:hypothetical protein